ncbi:MAG: FAD-binding oxidoreductase [Salinicola sp.]|uniref:FAD-binding oxidoreductase n=1 Tax=uncultured Salinicola sp. TaxID=1193542 RepID=UPI000C947AB7|nr:FAD-linked oxidase C-terminal domain-containing protein [uncultured Salinicola sp.]MAM56286.1 FAD-binding oxidoreductase [Salinicola sp.]
MSHMPSIRHTALPDNFIERLRKIVGERVSTSPSELERMGRGECWHPSIPPQVGVYPESTEEVAALVKLAAIENVAVVAMGAGTSLEGHTAALHGGVCLDLSRMSEILELRAEDLDVTVQAGVTRQTLNQYLRATGLFFPVDPGADATLGGMAATRASGTNAVRYGTMRENVLNLTVVLADGSVVRTASRARKSSAGYDLTRLFVGSEGTLGIVTEVTVRLAGIPEAESAAVCAFPDTASAITTATEIIQLGIPVARIEFIDDVGMATVNDFAGLDYVVAPTLFFDFHGTEAGVEEQAALASAMAHDNGGTDVRWASTREARNKLWQARHEFHYAILSRRPGGGIWGTDVCVPISRLTECILFAQHQAKRAPFMAVALGHVGDGNFHMSYLIDPDDDAERALADELASELAHHAIALGGTCTGEHGVGYGKSRYLAEEFGDTGVALMRKLKRALDPNDILNPGKILPPQS